MTFPRICSLLLAFTFSAACSTLLTAEPIGRTVRTSEQTWQWLREILAQRVSLVAHERPLEEVIARLSRQTGVRIEIDENSLDDLGVGTDEPVTVNLSNISLVAMLETMLSRLELTWTYRSEGLLIMTEEEEESALVTRAYPVGDLVKDDRTSYESEDFDSLIDVIVSTVASPTWAENGGGEAEVRYFPAARALVISQAVQTQLEIENLLDDLRGVGYSQGLAPRPAQESGYEPPRLRPRPRKYISAKGKWHSPRVYNSTGDEIKIVEQATQPK